MGAEKSKPVPADASQSTKNVIERENLKASQVVDQRRATVHRAAKARMSVIAMSGGYNSDGGPVAGFLPGGPALRPSLQDEQLPPGLVLPNNEDAHKTPKAVAPAAAGFQAGTALAYGTGVMKDPPKNVFGPGHVVSPDMYPEFHRATWAAEAGTGVPLGLLPTVAPAAVVPLRGPSLWLRAHAAIASHSHRRHRRL
eukprot:scaffold57684_cov104-Phaeocystis_antarctica.AAC.5